ncbi:MAG: DMT family transporter [Pseudomonadota bacterium]
MHSLFTAFNKLPDNARGALILLIAAAGFSLMAMLIKLVGANLHVTQIILVRQCVIFAIMLPGIVRAFPQSLHTSRPLLQLTRVAVALIAMTAGFTAVIEMPLADATAIGFAKSFFVTIFAIMILQEVVGIRRWSALVVGFAGVLIMLQPGGSDFSIYGVYALIGAAAAGMVMVIIRLLSRTEKPATILVYQAVGVAVVMLVPAMYYWQPPTATEWLLMLMIGLTGWISQLANIYAYKFGEASLLAPIEYTRLIYATIIGVLVFGDFPDIATIIGASIVVLASGYTIHREYQLKGRVSPP